MEAAIRSSGELTASVGRGVELCFETFGSSSDPALVLVMGLGMQMIAWPDALCERLAAAGYRVVRFDNRDSGLSTHLRDVPPPTTLRLVGRRFAEDQYDLADMAHDVAGLMDELDVERAHLVGVSMGGMIAQLVAIHHTERVRSLTSVMSNTGERRKGTPAPRVLRHLMRAPAPGRAAAMERAIELFGEIGSPGFPADDETVRAEAGRAFDRARTPAGTARQLAAIVKSGDRTAALRELRVPALVIHGTSDRMIRPSGGAATAAAIPGARLIEIDGMGHDLPRELWPRLADAIVAHARDADGERMHA